MWSWGAFLLLGLRVRDSAPLMPPNSAFSTECFSQRSHVTYMQRHGSDTLKVFWPRRSGADPSISTPPPSPRKSLARIYSG